MEAGDDSAPFRNSPFQEPLAITSKLGGPGEEHTRTTMDTSRERTMVVTAQGQKEHLDWLEEQC